jgi:tungstate transport system substrate-binding protein
MLVSTYRNLLAFFVVIVASMALVACGDDDEDAAGGEPTAVPAQGEFILATTTSTQDSGLLDVLLPVLEARTGWKANPIAVGSGQAMEMGRMGNADVLLVHSPAAELEFMEEGYGLERILVMHNDFILVGPPDDPAGVKDAATAIDAFAAIFESGSIFISRGDDSGTHALERKLWTSASLDPAGNDWYQESGQGMGATLQIAGQKQGYTVSDRATFLAQGESLDLEILSEGDAAYFNVYHVLTLNPEKNPGVKTEAGAAFAAFMVSEEAQAIIESFGVEEFGQGLFVPDAGKPEF